ncbi:HD domain protein [Orientia tsutsugamushi str. Kato PP]|nr:HD domain protein [Orientia tsutsugamushi str. Kato PP]
MLAFLNCEHINKLLDKLDLINHSFDKRINLDKVKKAIFYVKKYHGNQKRDTGEPYYMHPLEVAPWLQTTALKRIRLLQQYYMIPSKTQH